MQFLLDTHILLWWLLKDPSLPGRAQQLVADPANTIFVSAVSIWELRLKQSLGKLKLPSDFEQRLEQEFFESLAVTSKHGHRVGTLPWHHRDPFDRMLVAQAQIEKMVLLTADETLAAYGSSVLLCSGQTI